TRRSVVPAGRGPRRRAARGAAWAHGQGAAAHRQLVFLLPPSLRGRVGVGGEDSTIPDPPPQPSPARREGASKRVLATAAPAGISTTNTTLSAAHREGTVMADS